MSPYRNEIEKALEADEYRKPGLLFTQRMVETDHGVLSHENDREMIVVVVPNPSPGYWFIYGHVLKAQKEDGGSVWVALLVPSERKIDAFDGDTLFRRFHYEFVIALRYHPLFAQEHEDVFAIRESYEEACEALAEMIRRFDPFLREPPPDRFPYQNLPEPPGKIDLRMIDVYGLSDYKDENGELPDRP